MTQPDFIAVESGTTSFGVSDELYPFLIVGVLASQWLHSANFEMKAATSLGIPF